MATAILGCIQNKKFNAFLSEKIAVQFKDCKSTPMEPI
jgi:hypothetical protein